MVAIGAKYRWRKGKILHSAYLWKSPSRRRIPRLLIEDRALEVVIMMHLEGIYMVFEETTQIADKMNHDNAQILDIYYGKFHILPKDFENQDTFKWLSKPGNAFLLWGESGRYFIKPSTKS